MPSVVWATLLPPAVMFLPKAQETGEGKLKSLTSDEERLFRSRSRKVLDFLFGAIYCFIRGETGGQSSWTIKGNLCSVKLQIRARARHHSEKDALNLQLEGKCQKSRAPPKQVISCSTNLGQMCATEGKRLNDNKISPVSICPLLPMPSWEAPPEMDSNSGVKSSDSKNCGRHKP